MIPNILTTFRLIIIPFFAYSILSGQSVWLSVSLFLLSGLTDIVDGWIARHYNMITDVGSIYDPFVDKLMQITAIVCLAIENVVPLWVIGIVLLKELAMIVVGSVLYLKKIVVRSTWYGKFATVYFYALVFVFILVPKMNENLKLILLLSLAGVLVWAAFAYLVKLLKSPKSVSNAKKT